VFDRCKTQTLGLDPVWVELLVRSCKYGEEPGCSPLFSGLGVVQKCWYLTHIKSKRYSYSLKWKKLHIFL